MTQDTAMGDDSPHKRKRDADDMGGRAQKKVHVEDRNHGINDLHLDVGKKYLLCRTRKAPFYPFKAAASAAAVTGAPTSLIPWRLWLARCVSLTDVWCQIQCWLVSYRDLVNIWLCSAPSAPASRVGRSL
jgi:hypothetical protein